MPPCGVVAGPGSLSRQRRPGRLRVRAGDGWKWPRDGYSGRDTPARVAVRQRGAWRKPPRACLSAEPASRRRLVVGVRGRVRRRTAAWPAVKDFSRDCRNSRRKRRMRTLTGRKKRRRPAIQRWRSGDSPPPGTTQMQVGMKMEVLSPAMEHDEESGFHTQTFGIAGNGEQGPGGGAEEDVVDDVLL
jgi:hypothetical protein